MSLSFSVAPNVLRLSVMFLLEDRLKRISVFTDLVRMLFLDSAMSHHTHTHTAMQKHAIILLKFMQTLLVLNLCTF